MDLRRSYLHLQCEGNHLAGITGPGAPHVFAFDRRGELPGKTNVLRGWSSSCVGIVFRSASAVMQDKWRSTIMFCFWICRLYAVRGFSSRVLADDVQKQIHNTFWKNVTPHENDVILRNPPTAFCSTLFSILDYCNWFVVQSCARSQDKGLHVRYNLVWKATAVPSRTCGFQSGLQRSNSGRLIDVFSVCNVSQVGRNRVGWVSSVLTPVENADREHDGKLAENWKKYASIIRALLSVNKSRSDKLDKHKIWVQIEQSHLLYFDCSSLPHLQGEDPYDMRAAADHLDQLANRTVSRGSLLEVTRWKQT